VPCEACLPRHRQRCQSADEAGKHGRRQAERVRRPHFVVLEHTPRAVELVPAHAWDSFKKNSCSCLENQKAREIIAASERWLPGRSARLPSPLWLHSGGGHRWRAAGGLDCRRRRKNGQGCWARRLVPRSRRRCAVRVRLQSGALGRDCSRPWAPVVHARRRAHHATFFLPSGRGRC